MVFSSLTFLFFFLPLVLLCYYAAPKKAKNGVLFVFSLLFYAWGEPIYVLLMIFSTVVDYTCGRLIDKYRGTGAQKIGLIISLVINLGLLCFFKYSDFLIANINSLLNLQLPQHNLPLPIGISFYTFQTMSYSIDVYRNEAKVQKNIISFGAYVSLFPQLIAGPIVRYQDVAEQLNEREHSFDNFSEGVNRFVIGLAKKVLLANNIGLLWSTISKTDISKLSVAGAWLGIIAFSFQIYFDFSGYSDMAIGLGKMFGFSFEENFNYPYTAASVTDFWRRWHISLGQWFRDYLYIPLGGNRKGMARQILNISIVWLATGIWHGASWNYLLWGGFYGLLLIAEKLFLLKILKKIPVFVGRIYTLLAVMLGWVLFAFEDSKTGISYLSVMFGGGSTFINGTSVYQAISYLPLLLVCTIASLPVIKQLWNKGVTELKEESALLLNSLCIIVLLGLSFAYLISGSYNPFLYFRF